MADLGSERRKTQRQATRAASIPSWLALIGLSLAVSGCAEGVARPEVSEEVRTVALRPAPVERPQVVARIPSWDQYFDDISKGAILIDIEDRWLIHWEPGGASYQAYPIAVPLNSDLEKTGVTKIVRKREQPDWRPTPDMIRRNPEIPRYIGPGPQNPLGEYALYLGWTYYAIHGTNNPNAIGTRATSGCFRLHPEDIEVLFAAAEIGTPVMVLQDVET